MHNNTVFMVTIISLMIGFVTCMEWANYRREDALAIRFEAAFYALALFTGWYTVLAWINGGF